MAGRADPQFAIKCQLIDEVRQKPIIYNKGHPRHSLSSEQAEELNHISIAIGKTGMYGSSHIAYISVDPFSSTEIKNPLGIQGQQSAKIWKDLTDTYRRTIKSGSSGEPLDEKSSNWKFFDHIELLE